MLLAASSSGSLFVVAYCRTVIGRVSARSCQKMRECVWALAVEGENHPANLSGERKTRVCCTKSPARAISAMCQHTLARYLATTDEKGSDLESAPAWTAVGACARKPWVAPGVRGSVCTCRGRVVRPVGRGRRRPSPTDAVALFSSPRPGRWLWSVRVCRRCFPFGLPFLAGVGCCRFNTPSLNLLAPPDSRTFSLAVSV